jgi:hypothetical protein
MNFWLYIILEASLLLLIVAAVFVAFREATAEDPDSDSDNEPS